LFTMVIGLLAAFFWRTMVVMVKKTRFLRKTLASPNIPRDNT
jgi:hypothetical protein